MSAINWPSATTTTISSGRGILLRVQPDEGWYLVTDLTGLRHGEGETLIEALRSWAEHVESILGLPNLGEPLLSEVAAYRRALAACPPPESSQG